MLSTRIFVTILFLFCFFCTPPLIAAQDAKPLPLDVFPYISANQMIVPLSSLVKRIKPHARGKAHE